MKYVENLPFLSYGYCESLGITPADVIDSIERLVRGVSAGRVWNAPKATLLPGDGRYMMATLCASDTPPLMAVKSLVVSPDNSSRGLENINAAVILHDSESGVPLAVVDGNWVTAVRTAGLSAVAAKYLARRDSSVVAFIGCGIQASSHLDAFNQLFPLKQVRAVGRGVENRDRLCRQAEQMKLEAIPGDSAQEAITGADLVVTSLPISFDKEPFIDANWLMPGSFCTITDLALPWKPDSMKIFDRIVIDDLEQERKMDRPLVRPDLIDGDISNLVMGKIAERKSDEERCAFVFRGLAIGDLALATLAWQRHREGSTGKSDVPGK